MSSSFTESVVEEAALAWVESLGCAVKHGPEIAPTFINSDPSINLGGPR